MKFTLKDYQGEAVIDVLANLKKARKRWRADGDRHAFSLTAPTGAGKTVMAAAVFEALFHGDDGYNFDRDPGAVMTCTDTRSSCRARGMTSPAWLCRRRAMRLCLTSRNSTDSGCLLLPSRLRQKRASGDCKPCAWNCARVLRLRRWWKLRRKGLRQNF